MKDRIITKVGIPGAAGHIATTSVEGFPDHYKLPLFYHHREVGPDFSRKFKTVRADFFSLSVKKPHPSRIYNSSGSTSGPGLHHPRLTH